MIALICEKLCSRTIYYVLFLRETCLYIIQLQDKSILKICPFLRTKNLDIYRSI